MSVGFIQLGQCGNQLGQSFYKFMTNESKNSSPASQAIVNETFFIQKQEKSLPIAKALLIDMEPKVVNRCLLQNYDGFKYSQKFSFSKQEGSGNNWAYGYNVHGPKTELDLLDRMDSLLEETGFMEGFFLISSLAGGTGSGVGSYFQEVISNNYPHLNLINICVMPHLTGEVILQSLNATLTIQHLYQYGDGIIMLSNDDSAELCKQSLGIKNPSLDQINEVMCSGLSSFFWPAITDSNVSSTFQNQINYFQDTINNLLLDTRFKLLQLKAVPQLPNDQKCFSNDSWISIEKRINQMVLTGSKEGNIDWSQKSLQKCLGCYMIARGNGVNQHDFSISESSNFIIKKDLHQFNAYDKSISCLYNSQNITGRLEILVERATQMFQEKAYLYQYEKYGVDRIQFLDSLATFESIIHQYKKMK